MAIHADEKRFALQAINEITSYINDNPHISRGDSDYYVIMFYLNMLKKIANKL